MAMGDLCLALKEELLACRDSLEWPVSKLGDKFEGSFPILLIGRIKVAAEGALEQCHQLQQLDHQLEALKATTEAINKISKGQVNCSNYTYIFTSG